MSDHDDFGSFLFGVLVGGLAGAAAGLLLAPQSGEQTRVQIREKAIELRDQANTVYKDTLEHVEDLADDTAEKAEELMSQARKGAASLADKGQVILEKGKEKLNKA